MFGMGDKNLQTKFIIFFLRLVICIQFIMQAKSLGSTLRNIFQDAVIHIPYFASTIKPTSTLAISIQESQWDDKKIVELLSKQQHIIAHQFKLFYEKQTCNKTVIFQFQTIEQAKKFFYKYCKDTEKEQLGKTFMEQQKKEYTKKYLASYCKDISRNGINMQDILYKLGKVSIIPPQSIQIRQLIKEVAKLVVVEGIRGEQELLKCRDYVMQETDSYLLDFMDPKYLSSQTNYYRWKVYSYLQGDGDKKYRTLPFQITIGGPTYHPPQDYCEKYLYKVLSYDERQYITNLLETVTTRKYHVEEAMSFCVSNLSSAIQISCIIAVSIIDSCMSLKPNSQDQNKSSRHTMVKHLIALFYVISDILFNSPNTIYRDIFIVLLPIIMQQLPEIIELNLKVKQIVEIWNKKFIFEEEFLSGLTLLINKELPSMQPLGMEQMTRTQHDCYKELLKIETTEEIQAMCCKYGLSFRSENIAECMRNLAAVLAMGKKREAAMQIEPQPGVNDGQPLTEKDLQKIKSKSCRVVSCEDIPIKTLFEKSVKSFSYDKD